MTRTVLPDDLTGRARLRRMAFELFSERGFKATSMQAIAEAASVSPGLIRHHFGSKAGLRDAVDDDVLNDLERAIERVGPQGSLSERVGDIGALLADVFGLDEQLRGYVRWSLVEGSESSARLFGRLLDGATRRIEELADSDQLRSDCDRRWAPFQVLFVVLSPLLLERVIQANLDVDAFSKAEVGRRSAANQRLLLSGLFATGSR